MTFKINTLIIITLLLLSSLAFAGENSKNRAYLKNIIKTFKKECKAKRGIDYLNCWSEYTPDKCKGLVYGKDRSAWSRCVFSCGSASFYSKTFGACSI